MIISETTTEVKYVCKTSDYNSPFDTYYIGGSQSTDNIKDATRYSFIKGISTPSCPYSITSGSQTYNYNVPVEVSSTSTTTQRAEKINNANLNRLIINNPNQRITIIK